MAAGKFNHFRHSVLAHQDDKLRQLGVLLGRKKKEAYFYYFTLLELCAGQSDDGQSVFKIHQNTLRSLWETNAKGVQEMCTSLASCALVMCELCANHVTFSIPNLPIYLGSYETKKRKGKEKKGKENKTTAAVEETKKNLPGETPQENLKASPLSFLFGKSPEIQEWLNSGIHETHLMLLKKFSHHVLVEQVEAAYAWATPRGIKAEAWLYTFVSNKNTQGYGANRAKAGKTPATPDNPTGNPYRAQRLENEASA